MQNEELRRVQGIYINHDDLDEAIEHLHEQGYMNEEMCLVVQQGHQASSELKAYPIESFEVNVEKRSRGFLEKIKDLVLVEAEEDDSDVNLKDLGLEESTVERFSPALEEGSILLLVDSAAPRRPRHYYK